MLTEFLVAFAATVGFAIVFNVPIRYLLPGGIAGAVGWIIYRATGEGNSAIFFAALSIGILSEIGARILKIPVLIIAVPGIIPLVPGVQAYWTMLALMRGDFLGTVAKGTETLFAAGAIAAGIALASVPLQLTQKGGERGVRKTTREYFAATDPRQS